jgi:phosphatidate cytidylyltransferase
MGRHSAPRRGLFRPAAPGPADSASATPPSAGTDSVGTDSAGTDSAGHRSGRHDPAATHPPAARAPAGDASGAGTDVTSEIAVVLPDVVLAGGQVATTVTAAPQTPPPAAMSPGRAMSPGPAVSPRPAVSPGSPVSPGPAMSLATGTAVTAVTAVTAGPAVPGRAGRNLPLAIGVGLTLGALVLVPLFTYPPAFVVLVLAAVCIGISETVRAVQRVEARPPLVPLLAGGVGMTGLAWFAGPEALLVGLLLTIVALPVWRLADGPVGYQRDVTAGALISVYVPFLAGFCVLLIAQDSGPLRVAAFIATVVCSDTGGYIAGVLFGRHPMAPTVSPKKSWEGFAGSVLFCAVGGACFLVFGFDGQWWQGVLYGVAVAIVATLGDLAESMIKRDLNIKDMGTLLPGHGGLMDRLDSLLLVAPVAYVLLTFFAPPG